MISKVSRNSSIYVVQLPNIYCIYYFFQVYVGIEDVNDHFPQTSEPSYRVQVSEDAPSGTPVLQIKASDADVSKNFSSVSFSVKSVKGRGFYGVASDRPSVFSLGRDNGEIFL